MAGNFRKGLRFPNGIPRVETNRRQVEGCVDEMSDNQAETDIASATVAHNGDLRDRIAYAIAQADGDLPGMEPASCDYEMADAVIAVMREEKAVKNVAFKPPLVYTYGSPEAAIHDFNRAPSYVQQDLRLVHRYVTEWRNDE